MADRDEYHAQSLQVWRAMATGWEARRDWVAQHSSPVSDWIVGRVDPQPGQVVLELAAGPGDLGFRVAERVGPEGRLLSTDFAPEMVEAARRAGEARGVGNVEYRVLDAQRMDLDDDSVDAAVCRFGFMLMADPEAALRESRRVVRDGGPLAFAVWAEPEHNPWATVPAITLVQLGHVPPPEPGTPGIFALADRARIEQLVTGAGFAAPVVEEIAFSFRYADADDFWDALTSLAGPLARAINALSEDDRHATRAAVEASIEPYRQADGAYVMPAVAWGASAR